MNRRLLEDRKQEIVWFLRSTISTDEAGAMAGAGYRALPCGGCARRECPHCDAEPAEQVRTQHGKRADHDPRHVRVLLQRLSAFEHRVVAGVPAALASLPPSERLAILLEYGAGWTQDQVAAQLKCGRQTVARWRESGLERMVHHIWPPRPDEVPVGASS